MTLRHRLRMYMLNRQVNALRRKASRPPQPNEKALGGLPYEPVPDYSSTPGMWLGLVAAIALIAFLNLINESGRPTTPKAARSTSLR